MMNERIAYLSQIVDKIGAPLLLSILDDAVRNPGSKRAESMKDEAQKLAELLSRAVMLSIDLGKMIEIERAAPEYTESLRVAMAGLASPIVGRQYEQLRRPPAEADLKKISGALEAVLTFADNFSPSPENAIRLNLLNANGTPADAHQVTVQYLQAFVPVANVIASFPFGQSERKMMQETAERINQRASEMVGYVFGDTISADQIKLTELAFVRSLAELYSACHKREVERLMAGNESSAVAQQAALQGIWADFDTRTAMLETLAASLTPDHAGRIRATAPEPEPELEPEQVSDLPPEQPAAQAPPPQSMGYSPPPQAGIATAVENGHIEISQDSPNIQPAPVEDVPVSVSEPVESVPVQVPAQMPAQAPIQNTGNPMAMFARPRHEEAPPPVQEIPPEHVMASAPPPVSTPQVNTHSQPEQPVQTDQALHYQEQQAPEQISEQQPVASASPMAFFKTPPRDEQSE